MSRSTLLSGWFKHTPTRLIPLAHVRPTLVRPKQVTRVSLQQQQRFVQSAPKEYNSIESAAHHFKQQRHMPYFMEYLMWVVFGSEALHLIWLKIDYKEYKEKMRYKTKLLEEIIERVENGERIDDSLKEEIKMILMNNKHEGDYHDDIDDEYLNSCKLCTIVDFSSDLLTSHYFH